VDSSEKCQELEHPQDTVTSLDCFNQTLSAEASINIFGVQSYVFLK